MGTSRGTSMQDAMTDGAEIRKRILDLELGPLKFVVQDALQFSLDAGECDSSISPARAILKIVSAGPPKSNVEM